jgi:putative transposase
MARLPRFVLPGQPQHVIQRGNNRGDIFRAEADYRFYLEKLQAAADKHGCAIHAYVLMTNHVHLLLTPQAEDGIGRLMQTLGRHYVQFYNCCYRRTGTLWEGRYRATLIDSERYLLTCMRYIELNPVRGGMVERPSEYPWSSYRHNALGRPDPLLTAHAEYRRLGTSAEKRRTAYRQLFRNHIAQKTLDEIRYATNRAWVLGDDRFKRRVERHLERQIAPRPRGGDHKSADFRSRTRINRV